MAKKLIALKRKHTPSILTRLIIMPAIEGPTSLEPLNMKELRARAFRSSLFVRASIINDCSGISKALTNSEEGGQQEANSYQTTERRKANNEVCAKAISVR